MRTARERPSYTSASPPWPRWSGTPSRPHGSMTWQPGPVSWAGRRTRSASWTATWASPGSVTGQRDAFEGMVAEVALGQVGIILALEVSRLARDNAAWYRLLDLAGAATRWSPTPTASIIPVCSTTGWFWGMKGLMSEAELHVLRARLEGGIKNKAARGELRRGLPVGLVWGEADGEILLAPRRGRHRRHRRDLRPVRRLRVGARHLAVAARPGPALAAAARRLRPREPRSSGPSRPTTRCTTC